MTEKELDIPSHFDPEKTGEIWRVEYERLADQAENWARCFGLSPAYEDNFRICLLLVDIQNTFCIPEFELYVGGRSGTGAVDDNTRLCRFIYRYLDKITNIMPTMDTHHPLQVFHRVFLVNKDGEHPDPFTNVTEEDILEGRWEFNPRLGHNLNISSEYGQEYLKHYTRKLKESGKYNLTIWPYHAILGGIGHALVPAIEEAIFFHSLARATKASFHVKGDNPFTEHYSVIGQEVTQGPEGETLAHKDEKIFQTLVNYDAVIIAGQAKSHCVAWTIADLLEDVLATDKSLVEKVYLLEDCTSPVVIPGAIDYTEEADKTFRRFAEAGMHIVDSKDPISNWPGIIQK